MTQSKTVKAGSIEVVSVNSQGRKLEDNWTVGPQETISIVDEEAAEELGKLVAKAKGLNAWDDYLPGVSEVHRMCEEYPALDKAFEQFKTAWNLVVDDWESKNDE